MQGTARSGSGLRAHRVDQGSVAAAMGSDGSGSGLLWGRRHGRVRARYRGAQEWMQGTGGAQGTMMGARALVGRGARLWCRAGTLGVEEAGRRLTVGKAPGSVVGME